ERRLALWLRRFSACLARFLAEGVLATVELLENNWVNSEQITAANNAVASRGCQGAAHAAGKIGDGCRLLSCG
ncbi:hypothetical protein K3X19_14925, partial [Listeria monocytogenes]|nr:hypothetical protein [Listeria monocytogenes]